MKIADRLKATRHEYTFTDESGYRFTVTTEHDDEYGWNAYLSMACHGMRQAESAIHAIGDSARAFLRMLAEDTEETARASAGESREESKR